MLKTVLITGSSSGIGRAAAERFGARGWRVFASMRRQVAGVPLLALADKKGWKLTTPALDVTRDDSVATAVDAVLARDGRAARRARQQCRLLRLGPARGDVARRAARPAETNVIGVHRVTRAVLPAMRARRAGTVVTIGSISGRVAVPIAGPYHASKWALEGMIEAWRLELAPFGVRVALVEPGPFATALHANEQFAAASDPDGPYAGLVAAYRRQSARAGACPGSDAGHRRHRAGGDRRRPAAALAGRPDLVLGPPSPLRPRSALRVDHAAGVSAASASAVEAAGQAETGADPRRTDPSLRL